MISWYLRRYTGDSVHVAITNTEGQPVANFAAPGVAGISRINWDLHPTKDLVVRYGGQGAQLLVPGGEYTVTLTIGALKETGKVQVSIAPGVETR